MHGVRRELLAAQAQALDLPVYEVWIPQAASDAVYEQRMGAAVQRMVSDGIEAVAFGDLFLEDVRAYREKMMAPTGLEPLFPLWGAPTAALARRIIADGFRAVLACVDPRAVPAEFAGREYDEALLDEMPAEADPCAERGEFHTFVYDAPNFASTIAIRRGEVVEREGFIFADLLPA